ncbi:MAG: hypothetical protein IFJ96_01660 [Acidobacteria bacterium]|nr:hypothetical protein [Candidatus Sulfomarinibacter sp. MAG AM2]
MPGATSFPSSAAIPNRQTVLSAQGIPDGTAAPERVAALVDDAFEIYSGRVDPVGIRADISAEEFSAVYLGEGRNAPRTPLEGIFPDAHRLALFAITIGEVVCGEILRLFGDGDPALGYALDTIASAGAESLAGAMARDYQDSLSQSGSIAPDMRVLPYSPGYCGWHVSGQGKLFDVLRPERIGVSLNTSYLMQPLKSVSGVLVAADKEVHEFDIDFAFCTDCTDQECRERIQSIGYDT